MKIRILIFVLFLAPHVSKAASQNSSHSGRWMINGYYGLGFINPKDINDSANAQGTTPRLNSISGDTLYGGSLGFMLSPKFQFKLAYELQNAKNPVNTTSPFTATGAGYELTQNEEWGGINYFLVHTGKLYAYVGGSLGYPTYSH